MWEVGRKERRDSTAAKSTRGDDGLDRNFSGGGEREGWIREMLGQRAPKTSGWTGKGVCGKDQPPNGSWVVGLSALN